MQDFQSTISLSFTQGFILGQLSVCILLFLFIKFFIFGEAPTDNRYTQRPRSHSTPYNYNPIALSTSFSRPSSSSTSTRDPRHPHNNRKHSVLRPTYPLTTPTILAKTYYNVSNHQPESLDWFNVLIAQTIAQLRVDAAQDDVIVAALTAAVNGQSKPDFLDEIKVTELSLGDEFPIFSNCRVIPVPADGSAQSAGGGGGGGGGGNDARPASSAGGGGNSGSGDRTRLQARMDVDLSDAVTLGIETKLVLNYPKPRVAIMPVALAVSVVRFSGTLSVSFIPSPSVPVSKPGSTSSDPTPPTTLTFSFLPSYRLELSTHSLLGSRSRLQDVPKIAQLVEARLHAWFDKRCVAPRFQQVVLPSLWPRAQNTRGGGSSSEDGDGVEEGDGIGASRGEPRKREREEDLAVGAEAGSQMVMPRRRFGGGGGDADGGVWRGSEGVRASGYRMPGSMPET